MARVPRKVRESAAARPPTPPPRIPGTGFATQEVPHIRCPVCSLQARHDLVEGGPYEPQARVQTYGGSRPKPFPESRHPGILQWTDPEPLTVEDLQLLQSKLAGAIDIVNSLLSLQAEKPKPARKRRAKPRD